MVLVRNGIVYVWVFCRYLACLCSPIAINFSFLTCDGLRTHVAHDSHHSRIWCGCVHLLCSSCIYWATLDSTSTYRMCSHVHVYVWWCVRCAQTFRGSSSAIAINSLSSDATACGRTFRFRYRSCISYMDMLIFDSYKKKKKHISAIRRLVVKNIV